LSKIYSFAKKRLGELKMKKTLLILFIILFIFIFNMSTQNIKENGLYAVIKTNFGDMTAKLFFEEAPVTVGNFVGLAEGTLPFIDMKTKQSVKRSFYNGIIFHRVIKNFMIQAGCPLGVGTGGPGYVFPNETRADLKHDSIGILSMANAGPDTNGSQFFITLGATPHLDGGYSIFGKLVSGIEVLKKIGDVKTGQNDKPADQVVINEIKIIRVGDAADKFDALKAFSKKDEILKKREEDGKKQLTGLLKNLGVDESKIIKAENGLKHFVIKSGNGKKPAAGDKISAHYSLYLENGKKIDSSIDRNEPIVIKIGVGEVIPGWDIALQDMKEGERRILIVPYTLGYGERGIQNVVPPNATLVFDVELIKVIK